MKLGIMHLFLQFTVASLSRIFVRSRRDWEKKCRVGTRQVQDIGGNLQPASMTPAGKFAAGFVDTGGKFATGVNNTRGTGGKICRRCRSYRWQICHWCHCNRRQFATGVIDTGGAP
jgi:hypothetical protein